MSKIRLNKFLAQCGVSSRRAADKLIEAGKIKVNGIVVSDLGIKIDPDEDRVVVGEIQIRPRGDLVYYLLNKPKGYITTSFDPLKRRKVVDLLPKKPRVFSVGRLDKDTRGLLILTNDGDLTYRLTHPKFEKEKEYIVQVKKQQSNQASLDQAKPDKTKKQKINIIEVFKKGVKLREGIAKADEIEVLEEGKDWARFRIVIHQGWKRQIRRMCDKIGLKVLDLIRTRIGNLELGDLKEGEWRKLEDGEIEKLLK